MRLVFDQHALGSSRLHPILNAGVSKAVAVPTRKYMSKLLLSRLVIMIFAIASSGTLLMHEVHQFVHQAPRVVGVPGVIPEDLRTIIPNGESLGFITDQTNPELMGLALHAANYSLAPFIVENTVSRRFLLGSFRDKSSSAIALRQYGLTVVRDFGNGFLLLARQ